jgi:TRAP-type mannitol/chloroaromatic compound transport system permease small subunit
MKKIIQIYIDITDALNIFIGSIFSIFFIPLMFLSVYEVITRRIMGNPTIWTLEMTSFIFVPIVVLAMGYTLLHKGHATIDVFSEKFSDKTKAVVDSITIAVFLLPSSLIMFLNSLEGAMMSWASMERTPSAFNAPIYPIKTFLPIGFALLFLAALSWFVKSVYFVFAKEQIESKIMMRLKPSTNIKDL